MAWTNPRTWIGGELVDQTQLNEQIRDNMIVLRAGGIALTSQANQDVIIATSSTQFGRVAKGSALQVLRVSEDGASLEFGVGAIQPYNDPLWVGRTRFGGPY